MATPCRDMVRPVSWFRARYRVARRAVARKAAGGPLHRVRRWAMVGTIHRYIHLIYDHFPGRLAASPFSSPRTPHDGARRVILFITPSGSDGARCLPGCGILTAATAHAARLIRSQECPKGCPTADRRTHLCTRVGGSRFASHQVRHSVSGNRVTCRYPNQARYAKIATARLGLTFGNGYVFAVDNKTRRIISGAGWISSYPINNALSNGISRDKAHTKAVLRQLGIEVIHGSHFITSQAHSALRNSGHDLTDALPYKRRRHSYFAHSSRLTRNRCSA